MKELLVKVGNPQVLDRTLNSIGGVVGQNSDGSYFQENNCYIVRAVSGDIGFLKFAIQSQGYAKIIQEREIKVAP